jgi:hypothetical protein
MPTDSYDELELLWRENKKQRKIYDIINDEGGTIRESDRDKEDCKDNFIETEL